MSAGCSVRPATVGDLATIAKIHVRSWQHAYRGQMPDWVLDGLDEGKRAARWLEWLDKPGYRLDVALRDGAIIGFCSLIPCRDEGADDAVGQIAALYIDPSSWRVGAGTALVDAALAHARTVGYRALTLWVLTANDRARQFYERVGFAPDGASKVDTRPGYSLAELRYRRELQAPQ